MGTPQLSPPDVFNSADDFDAWFNANKLEDQALVDRLHKVRTHHIVCSVLKYRAHLSLGAETVPFETLKVGR